MLNISLIIFYHLFSYHDHLHLFTLKELQSLIINTFPGEKTYLTKESGTKESLIKSTTDSLKFIHLLEMSDVEI